MNNLKGCCRYATSAFLALSLILSSAFADSVDGLSHGNAQQLLQEKIVEGLASGADVKALLAEYVKQYSNRARVAPNPRSEIAAEFQRQLQSLHSTIKTIIGQGGLNTSNYRSLINIYTSLEASNLLINEKHELVQSTLGELDVSSEFEQRRIEAHSKYRDQFNKVDKDLRSIIEKLGSTDTVDSLLSDISFSSRSNRSLNKVLSYLQSIKQTIAHKILGANTLPYGHLYLAATNPVMSPVITPVYRRISPVDRAADLAPSLTAPLSAEILAKAAALNNDYIAIYDFVRSQIKTEWYAGSMKGAVGTLRQMSGNDVDQASLLVALFRASGLASRFVQGVVELPIEDVMDSLALTTSAQAVTALTKSGVKFTPLIQGGRVGAVQIEQIWVAAKVPYNNYRGAVIDKTGASWLPLMPGVKTYQNTAATDILKTMGIDTQAEVTEYLSKIQSADLLTLLKQKVSTYLTEQGQLNAYSAQLGESKIQVDDLGLIPHTLPVTVVAVTGEFAELPDSVLHKIRFVARDSEKNSANIVLDYTVPVVQLASERVTLSYMPATVEDQKIINLYGGIAGVPAYLVKLRPQIKINGRQKSIASNAVSMGTNHLFEITLQGPAGSKTFTQNVIAGGYHAIAVNAQRYVDTTKKDDPADTEYQGAKILSQTAHAYASKWDAAEKELAGLHNVAVIRPLPSINITSNVYKVDLVFGQPYQLEFQGVTLDAIFRVAEPVARSSDKTTESSWMQMSALQGSLLESSLFEAMFLVQSISADKGLQLANEQGIAIVSVNSNNVATVLPGLLQATNVLDDVQNWVRLGMTVQIPVAPITFNDWNGAVWRVENPTTKEAGYFISGGLAGGATSTYPVGWVLDWLRWVLTNPNAGLAANSGAAMISGLFGADKIGKVGEPLSQQLSVLIRNSAGLPVVGASVTFYVANGGGTVNGASSVTVKSNSAGRASATYTLGQSTDNNPVYLKENSSDQYVSKAGLNVIEASVQTKNGALAIRQPFTALGFPKTVVTYNRTDSSFVTFTNLTPGMWVDRMFVSPLDEFGNIVSNHVVNFNISTGNSGCGAAAKPGRLFIYSGTAECPAVPTLDDTSCGAATQNYTSTTYGTTAAVIVSDAARTTSAVTVSGGGTPLAFSYTTSPYCGQKESLVYNATYLSGINGQNIQAAGLGKQFAGTVDVSVFLKKPYINRISAGQIYWESNSVLQRLNANVVFSVQNGNGYTTGTISNGGGRYSSYFVAGSQALNNPIEVSISDITEPVILKAYEDALQTASTASQADYASAELDRITRWLNGPNKINIPSVYSLEPLYTGVVLLNPGKDIDPTRLRLTDDNLTEYAAQLNYTVSPAQYFANDIFVEIYKNNTLAYSFSGKGLRGVGYADLPRGLRFNRAENTEVQIVVNKGSQAEVISARFPLQFEKRLFKNVSKFLKVSTDVDALNERVCQMGKAFEFELTEEANITLEFTDSNTNVVTRLIDNVTYPAGKNSYLIAPGDISRGFSTFRITGVTTASSYTESKNGWAKALYEMRDNLPVGHTIVKGVNVFNGSVSTSSTDLSVPGRGSALELRRTYGSGGSSSIGVMGAGWSHNYDSKIVITPCGEVIVTGGQGGGMRFVEDANGVLQPLKGYHGTLTPDFTDNSFDFYSRDGTRYHYKNLLTAKNAWHLVFIEDTNGNITKMSYDTTYASLLTNIQFAKLTSVEDPAGRVFKFTWADKTFTMEGTTTILPPIYPVITQIEGPDNQIVQYTYDQTANLIKAERISLTSNPLTPVIVHKSESYQYNNSVNVLPEQRSKLLKYINPNGAATRYTYKDGSYDIQDGTFVLTVPYSSVATITEAEGGVTTFNYQTLPTKVTTVTNTRGFNTEYTMNKYGSVISNKDPLGNVTTMVWSATDVLMDSLTDANGVKTDYTYDANANKLTEKINTGLFSSYTSTYTYASIPAKPWIKNRVASKTDRNGNTTLYEYDANGNLTKTTDAEANVITYTYATNGDRIGMVDARNNPTSYYYNLYGNLESTTDALGNIVKTDWNSRGLPTQSIDARNAQTLFEYDELNRLTTKTDTYFNTKIYSYDDVGNKLTETDEEGRVTAWTYDLQNRVKTVTDAINNVMSYYYDGENNKTRQTDWRGNDTTYDYDSDNRLITQTQLTSKVNRYTYDPVDNLLTEQDPEGRITTYRYDALNRRQSVTDALGQTQTTAYDGMNKTQTTDKLGRTTSYAYDRLNRLTTVTQPLGRITQTAYDANSNKISQTDANGNVTQIVYDVLNRVDKRIDAEANVATNFYDANSNLILEVNERLFETKHEYDRLNRRTRTLDLGGYLTTFEYDKVGNPTTQTLPNSNVVTTVYDPLNRTTGTTDLLGAINTYSYDANGNVLTETDANGNITTHRYDIYNRRVQSDLPEARTVKTTYDRVDNKLTETDANNNITTYVYDALNRVTNLTDALNGVMAYRYDAVGNKLSETDKRNFTTNFIYDALNQLTTVTDPLTQTVQYSYDRVGNKLTDTDKRGTLSSYSYDKLNRVLTTTKDNLVINKLEYDEVGNVKFSTDANANITAYIYDKRNLLITESLPLAAITNYQYDSLANRTQTRDPESRIDSTTYDLRNRILTQTNGLGETTTHTYDLNGNRLSTRRPNGNTWNYSYDAADRLTDITDPLLGVTAYAYDKNSNKLSQTDALNNTTTYTYDALNRQTQTTYADAAIESYGYDANNNRSNLTDAKGQAFSYVYDALNRETRRTYPLPAAATGDDIQSIVTTYDANSNPLTILETYTGATGTRITTKTYDRFDRLLTVTDAFNKTIKYSYDANGNRTRLTDPDNTTTRYTYDEVNRLNSVTTLDGISNYAYDRSSLQTRIDYANGTQARTQYDNARRTRQITNKQGSAVISQYDYLYDTNGNRIQQIENNGTAIETTTYQYDSNDRLRLVNYPDANVVYTYDANYNRQTETTTSIPGNTVVVNKTYNYNNRNQLTNVTDNLNATQNVIYQFDANGNQIVKNKNAITTNFIYDVRDKLISVREGATTQGTYLYDYLGLRVQKNGSQGLVKYTYDDDSVLLQTDTLGTTLAKYEYGPDRLLSLNHTTEGRQYYHFDALGSTVNLTKPDASLQARYQYDAFGNFRSQTGSSWNNFGFTGHEKDTATNLIYFKARHYDPDTGRFLNQDPYLGEASTPPSLHRYLYAYSNPTVYVDLDGYSARAATEKALEESVKNSASGGSSAVTQRDDECGQGCVYTEIEAIKEVADKVKSGYENAQRMLWRFLLNRLPVPNSPDIDVSNKQEKLIDNPLPTSTSTPDLSDQSGLIREPKGKPATSPPVDSRYEGGSSEPTIPWAPEGYGVDAVPDFRASPKPNQEGLVSNKPYLSEEGESKKPYSDPTKRPPYGDTQVDDVWESSKKRNGKVYDPNTGELLNWDKSKSRAGQWDMGHLPGKEYRKLHKDYMDDKITKEEFLRRYRDRDNYKPEDPSSNRSGKHEEK